MRVCGATRMVDLGTILSGVPQTFRTDNVGDALSWPTTSPPPRPCFIFEQELFHSILNIFVKRTSKMSPIFPHQATTVVKRLVNKITDPDGLVLEGWAEGFMVGSLIILSCITIANMRHGVLLHKLILLEVGYPS